MTEKGQQHGDLVHLYDSESSAACSPKNSLISIVGECFLIVVVVVAFV